MESSNGADAIVGIVFLGFFVVWLALVIFMIVASWKVFTKAGEAGWKSLIPIYNVFVLTKIAGLEWYWALLSFVPVFQLIPIFLIHQGVAKNFGFGNGFAFGLTFLAPIFYPILALGSAEYMGGDDDDYYAPVADPPRSRMDDTQADYAPAPVAEPQRQAPASPASRGQSDLSEIDDLDQLSKMKLRGDISPNDFDRRKREIMDDMKRRLMDS